MTKKVPTPDDARPKTQEPEAAAAASEKFDTWAIVELMGHRKIAGRVTEQIIAGAPLLRIDVPEVVIDGQTLPGFTQFYGASSVYCLTPTTEDIARRFTAYHRERPVAAYELKALPANVPTMVADPEDND